MPQKISIIGAGYVGLTSGVCLASLGHQVICVDKDKDKLGQLEKAIIPIYEPGLAELLKEHQTNISFTDDLAEAVKQSDVIFIAVGTPSLANGDVDLSFFEQAVVEAARNMQGYKVIVDKSTVPVGAGDWVKNEIKKYFFGEFSVVSNPEFLREGTAIKDFLRPDRVVIGCDNNDTRAKNIMSDIYCAIDCPKFITDLKSAEMIKYASNSFLAAKISFINEIANICEKTGANVGEVAQGMGLDSRIGPKFLQAGIGFGGSCFPKDVAGLISIAQKNNYSPLILQAVMAVNESQRDLFAEKIIGLLQKNNGKTAALWGLAFKPETDDIRHSPAVDIIKKLLTAGFNVQAYDPAAMDNMKAIFPSGQVKFCDTALQAVEKADVLALVTDWLEFSQTDFSKVKSAMRLPIIIDGRNFLDPIVLRNLGFDYFGIGRTDF